MRPTIRIGRLFVTWKDLWTGSYGLEIAYYNPAYPDRRSRVFLDVGFRAVEKEPHA